MRETRQRSDYKTPLLGDIPGIGKLFRSERDQRRTTELVILLRPVIVADNDDWTPMVDEPMKRVEDLSKKGDLK